MRNFILVATAVAALSFAASDARADHFRHRRVHHHHAYAPRHVVPYHAYRHVPVYAYPRHYYQPGYHHNYHYAQPGYYSGGGVAVNGRHLSLYIGF